MPGNVGRGREENAPVVKPHGGAMVEAIEEGRFELNFYGALAWASSYTRVHALELSSMLRPIGLVVTLFNDGR